MTNEQKILIKELRLELTEDDWCEIWNCIAEDVQEKLPADGKDITEEDIASLDAEDWAHIWLRVTARHKELAENASDRLEREWRDHMREILDHLKPLAKTLKPAVTNEARDFAGMTPADYTAADTQCSEPVPCEPTAPAKIQIKQYRFHGSDDDTVEMYLIAAGEQEITIEDLYAEGKEEDMPDEIPESGYGAIYTIDDFSILDGETMLSRGGRKFRVTLTEVTE